MKKWLLVPGIILVVLCGSAHEFWLHPQKFFFTIRETARISFRVGENFSGENWGGNSERVEKLVQYLPSGAVKNLTLTDKKGDSLILPMREEGTHMIIFNSNNSFIELEAQKFTAYLLDEGLTNAIAYRHQNNEDTLHGKEYYQRSVKTIVQVNTQLTDACTRPTALPLDIVPQKNPYSVPESGTRKTYAYFHVYFRGVPLQRALVKAWYAGSDGRMRTDSAFTDKEGLFRAERHSGAYMLSCVYMERSAGEVANWQSYWSSLTFQYPEFYRADML